MNIVETLEKFDIKTRVIAGLTKLDPNRVNTVLSVLERFQFVTNNRSTRRLGQCQYSRQQIEIHAELLKTKNEAEKVNTLLHEVAHAVAWVLFRERGHGRDWRRVMIAFGCAPDRVNSSGVLDSFRIKRANYTYACRKCGYEHHTNRRKKYAASTYIHRDCGGKLYLKYHKRGKKLWVEDKMTSTAFSVADDGTKIVLASQRKLVV